MNNNDRKAKILSRFRVISIAEGTSFLLLLFIAMPLKYWMDMPLAVKYVGWAHGALFVLYVGFIFPTSKMLKWSYLKTFMGLVASVLPFGPFVFDRKIMQDQKIKDHSSISS